jgi:hypothetical protein
VKDGKNPKRQNSKFQTSVPPQPALHDHSRAAYGAVPPSATFTRCPHSSLPLIAYPPFCKTGLERLNDCVWLSPWESAPSRTRRVLPTVGNRCRRDEAKPSSEPDFGRIGRPVGCPEFMQPAVRLRAIHPNPRLRPCSACVADL